jgi:hypothetical protein
MKIIKQQSFFALVVLSLSFAFCLSANAQGRFAAQVLDDAEAEKIVPTTYYFAGQSAPTQMRNAFAARIGKDRHVLAGLVDTSGYSTEISGKYEGFFITDSPISIGNRTLGTGAYGFGFSKNGSLNIFDISSRQILSVASQTDANMKRPRPLQMVAVPRGVRLYKGRNFVLISAR